MRLDAVEDGIEVRFAGIEMSGLVRDLAAQQQAAANGQRQQCGEQRQAQGTVCSCQRSSLAMACSSSPRMPDGCALASAKIFGSLAYTPTLTVRASAAVLQAQPSRHRHSSRLTKRGDGRGFMRGSTSMDRVPAACPAVWPPIPSMRARDGAQSAQPR
jgi:hypothetical protein